MTVDTTTNKTLCIMCLLILSAGVSLDNFVGHDKVPARSKTVQVVSVVTDGLSVPEGNVEDFKYYKLPSQAGTFTLNIYWGNPSLIEGDLTIWNLNREIIHTSTFQNTILHSAVLHRDEGKLNSVLIRIRLTAGKSAYILQSSWHSD